MGNKKRKKRASDRSIRCHAYRVHLTRSAIHALCSVQCADRKSSVHCMHAMQQKKQGWNFWPCTDAAKKQGWNFWGEGARPPRPPLGSASDPGMSSTRFVHVCVQVLTWRPRDENAYNSTTHHFVPARVGYCSFSENLRKPWENVHESHLENSN